MTTKHETLKKHYLEYIFSNVKNTGWGFPVARTLPANASNEGSIPGPGTGIPHATGQLGPCSPTTEAALCSATREATSMRSRLAVTKDSPRTTTKTQWS